MGRSISHWVEKKLMYFEATDSRGDKHMICRQRRTMSCGIACIAMVVYRKHGVRLLESSLRGYSQALDQMTGQRTGASISNKTRTEGFDEVEGTRPYNLVIMLRKMRVEVDYRYQSGRATTILPGASPQTPVIAGIKWDGGGGHWILVDGWDDRANRAIVCDPYYGLVESSVAGGKYSTPSGSSGQFDAT